MRGATEDNEWLKELEKELTRKNKVKGKLRKEIEQRIEQIKLIEEDTEQILKKYLGANTPSREDVEFELMYDRINNQGEHMYESELEESDDRTCVDCGDKD